MPKYDSFKIIIFTAIFWQGGGWFHEGHWGEGKVDPSLCCCLWYLRAGKQQLSYAAEDVWIYSSLDQNMGQVDSAGAERRQRACILTVHNSMASSSLSSHPCDFAAADAGLYNPCLWQRPGSTSDPWARLWGWLCPSHFTGEGSPCKWTGKE